MLLSIEADRIVCIYPLNIFFKTHENLCFNVLLYELLKFDKILNDVKGAQHRDRGNNFTPYCQIKLTKNISFISGHIQCYHSLIRF